jgi:hypothetical protein
MKPPSSSGGRGTWLEEWERKVSGLTDSNLDSPSVLLGVVLPELPSSQKHFQGITHSAQLTSLLLFPKSCLHLSFVVSVSSVLFDSVSLCLFFNSINVILWGTWEQAK